MGRSMFHFWILSDPNSNRVNWSVIKHLSGQGRPDRMGGLYCFWCPNKIWSPHIEAFDTLKILNNGIELRKLQPTEVEGVKN
jgi:hypothetical protein